MKLIDDLHVRESLPAIFAGGFGSGCHGPNCGRPPKAVGKIAKTSDKLTPFQKKAETNLRRAIAENPEKLKAEYRAKFGNVLNVDNARELSEDYRNNRLKLAQAVHEPASQLVKQMLKEEIDRPTDPGKSNTILFTAGAPGAGKTTAIEGHSEAKAVFDQAHAVMDGTMANPFKAINSVTNVLSSGKQVAVLYVHRDPVDAFKNGVLPRAMATGRTVVLDEFAKQHANIQDSMKQLHDAFKFNPNFSMTVLDNSRGFGNAKASKLSDLPSNPGYDKLKPVLQSVLEKAYATGKISKAVYKATLGNKA